MPGELTTLRNIGNSCYINSIIQIIRHTQIFNDFLNNHSSILNETKETNILKEWNSLRETMWKQTCVVSPYRFVHYIRNGNKTGEITNNFNQQDVGEFLIMLLDEFHECLKRPVRMNISGEARNKKDKLFIEMYAEYKTLYENNFSELIDMFYGLQVTNIKRLNTNKILSRKIEPFSILNLAILSETSNPTTLYDCMNDYCKTEELSGDNKWYNEKTNEKEEVEIATRFIRMPKTLIISLKKYVNEKQLITYPLQDLDMTPYVINASNKVVYELYGVCIHEGIQSYGHYYSYVKIKNKWFCFNDNMVREIKEKTVVSKSAYCLFYKRTN
tara:strand:- start:3156 stop:4142 length:987 start_codon:yes stop_codon:yes gene_type:complete